MSGMHAKFVIKLGPMQFSGTRAATKYDVIPALY